MEMLTCFDQHGPILSCKDLYWVIVLAISYLLSPNISEIKERFLGQCSLARALVHRCHTYRKTTDVHWLF